MRLWLLRHAQPLIAPGVCYGATDLPADAQATQVAAQAFWQAWDAAGEPAKPLIACSPLGRCLQLADALQALRPGVVVQRDERLREFDFGCWEQVPWADIPPDALARWTADFSAHAFGGCETVGGFIRRVGQAVDAARVGPAQPQVWVSHAGVARALQWLAQDAGPLVDAAQWPRAAPGFGAYAVLNWA
ncbi:MAG: hypothetical protein RLZZ401_1254 [Pseudomonadota bacterium]